VSVLQRTVAVVLLALPTALWALGVGGIEVSSGLNQRFDASFLGHFMEDCIIDKRYVPKRDILELSKGSITSAVQPAIEPFGTHRVYITRLSAKRVDIVGHAIGPFVSLPGQRTSSTKQPHDRGGNQQSSHTKPKPRVPAVDSK